MQAKESKYQPRSRWSILFLSLLFAMILSMAFISTLSADDHGSDDKPKETGGSDLTGEQDTSGGDRANAQDSSITGTLAVSATVEVTPTQQYTQYLPLILTKLDSPVLSVVNPNSSNQWQINWYSVRDGATYQVQESQDPDFQNLISDETIPGTSKSFQHNPSPYNSYYYRVRTHFGGFTSLWSVAKVNGAYRDDFDQNNGWAMRRTSLLHNYEVRYDPVNHPGNLIILLSDRFDWFMASPLAEAPKVPYVIEYRSRVHDASNLVSGGIVLGGDWNGGVCPDINNMYYSNTCFNHFYDFNYIWYGPLKMQFEQVDWLLPCINCEGSFLKRQGDYMDNWPVINPIIGPEASTAWHTYRVEVRESGLTLYIDGNFKQLFNNPGYFDSRWGNEPYVGVLASTFEYEPSIWFYDYYAVTPLN